MILARLVRLRPAVKQVIERQPWKYQNWRRCVSSSRAWAAASPGYLPSMMPRDVNISWQRQSIHRAEDVKSVLSAIETLLPQVPPNVGAELLAGTIYDLGQLGLYGQIERILEWFTESQDLQAASLRGHLATYLVLFKALTQGQLKDGKFRALIARLIESLDRSNDIAMDSVGNAETKRSASEAIVNHFSSYSWFFPPQSVEAYIRICERWKFPAYHHFMRTVIAVYGRIGHDKSAKIWLDRALEYHASQAFDRSNRPLLAKLVYYTAPIHSPHTAAAEVLELVQNMSPETAATTQLEAWRALLKTSSLDKTVSAEVLRNMLDVVVQKFSPEPQIRAGLFTNVIFGLIRRGKFADAIAIWEDLITPDPSLPIRDRLFSGVLQAYMRSGQTQKALDTLSWYAKCQDGEQYALPAGSPLSTFWPGNPPPRSSAEYSTGYCPARYHLVPMTTPTLNVILEHLVAQSSYQTAQSLFNIAFNQGYFGHLEPNDRSYICLFRSAALDLIGPAKKIKDAQTAETNDFSLSGRLYREQRANEAVDMGWAILEKLCARPKDPTSLLDSIGIWTNAKLHVDGKERADPNTSFGSLSSYIDQPIKIDFDPANLFFASFIQLLGASGNAKRVPLALAYQKAIRPNVPPSKREIAFACLFFHQCGPMKSSIKALDRWLLAWVGERRMPTDAERGAFFKLNIRWFSS